MENSGRRDFLKRLGPAAAALSAATKAGAQNAAAGKRPNVLFLMADQFRFDAIAALGNREIYTPNIDRLVKGGVTFTNTYSQCPVCVAARYGIRTGCEPTRTRVFSNAISKPLPGQESAMQARCGTYLAETMRQLGYRTFGVGKFHTNPWDEKLGYDVHLHSEELYGTPDQRKRDSFAAWIRTEKPAYNFIEGLMGERTDMYYMPQMSPMPADATVERWAAERAIEQIEAPGDRPYFGFVSFIGPHPPFAPPIPFNRLYDPDRMPNPIRGELALDHMDEQIPWMNYAIWAEDVNDSHNRILRARYYGEITYIDDCIGRILKAVDAENTVVCFFSDHGDHLGDHHGWQKESYFEASTHVPFVVNWPGRTKPGAHCEELVALTDLFGLATEAAGKPDYRMGTNIMGALEGKTKGRDSLFGYYGEPGTQLFKIMARTENWKYIYFANGAREQLFDLKTDPNELTNLAESNRRVRNELRASAIRACNNPEGMAALNGADFREFPFKARPLQRIYQFDRSRGVTRFPASPRDVLSSWT
jgi:arylsulfatase